MEANNNCYIRKKIGCHCTGKCEYSEIMDEIENEPYGWCIEWNINSKYSIDGGVTWKETGFTGWHNHYKHKIYLTKEVCLEALKAVRNTDSLIGIKYRIFPVYHGKIEEIE